jgi:23S rRNA pseudouridine2605 synthase
MERLQKIIAAAGIASRREAEQMILRGEVTLNGKRVTELGTKADPERDHVKVKGKLITPMAGARSKRYILVNKPRGYLSSTSDPKMRPLVMDLVPAALRRGLHAVGRLDFNTEGLIILTDDGQLTQLLTKAGVVPKVYRVKVKGGPQEDQIDLLRRGIRLGATRTAPARITLLASTREAGNTWFEVTLHQGRNQQIRRMFDSIGHSVTKLRRVAIGHLTDRGLAPGQYRELTAGEVARFFRDSHRAASPRPRKASRR